MILYYELDVNKILKEGKNYFWPRPVLCPDCKGRRLWGHGYVQRYFDGGAAASILLWLKRYRCPDCGAVHTLRPYGFWRRFLVQSSRILASLKEKIIRNQWLPEFSRQRQKYWMQGLKQQLDQERFSSIEVSAQAVRKMVSKGIILSTHSTDYFTIRPARPFYVSPPS